MKIHSLPLGVKVDYSQDIEEPVAKRTRLQTGVNPLTTPDPVKERNPKVVAVGCSKPTRIFDRTLLGRLGKEDVLNAIREENLELAFDIIDMQRFSDSDAAEIEELTGKMDWSGRVKDLEFWKIMGKIQIALKLGSKTICEALWGNLSRKDRRYVQDLFDRVEYEYIEKGTTCPEIDVYDTQFTEFGTKDIHALLGRKEAGGGLKLTEEDMERVDSSSYLRHLLYPNATFCTAVYSNKLSLHWFEIIYQVDPRPLFQKNSFITQRAFEQIDFDMVEISTRNLQNCIGDHPSLLSLTFPPKLQDLILSRFRIHSLSSLLRFGSDSTILYFLKKQFPDLKAPFPEELMDEYLGNEQFNLERFHQFFQMDEKRILNLNLDSDYGYTLKIMQRRPEVVMEILKKYQDSICSHQRAAYLDMHFDRPYATARFNLDLVEFYYGKESCPGIVDDLLTFQPYRKGDLQKVLDRYPDLKAITLDKIKDFDLGFVPTELKKDLIEVYSDQVFHGSSNIYHLMSTYCDCREFLKLVSRAAISKLTQLDDRGHKPFDRVLIVNFEGVVSERDREQLLSLGNYSTLFNSNMPLLPIAVQSPTLFRNYLEKEPYLMEHFKRPWCYSNSTKEAMALNYTNDTLFTYLLQIEGCHLSDLQKMGLDFDPLSRDSKNNTLYHIHPSYVRGFKQAKSLQNARGETPLWNPSPWVVGKFIEMGADPSHRSHDRSNFLHSYKMDEPFAWGILRLPVHKIKKLLVQKNSKGEIAIYNLLKAQSPSFLMANIITLEDVLKKLSPPLDVYVLDIILKSSVGSLPYDLRAKKEALMKKVVDHLDFYRSYFRDVPYVFRSLLIQYPNRFTQEELFPLLEDTPPLVLIEYLFSNELIDPALFERFTPLQLLSVLPLLPADQIKGCIDTLPDEHLLPETIAGLDLYLGKVLSHLKRIEQDWITWFNTTQEELKSITLEQTALLTRMRTDAIFSLLPYFYNVQQAVIIPLLPLERLQTFLLPLPIEKASEYLLYATSAQKMALFPQISLIPEPFRLWDPKAWQGKTKADMAPLYTQLTAPSLIERFRRSFLRNLEGEKRARVLPRIEAAQREIERVQSEVRQVYSALSEGISIPEKYLDALTYEELENPIRIPGLAPQWIGKTTWDAYRQDPENYKIRVNNKKVQLPEGEIRHPIHRGPVKIADFKEDPQHAQDLVAWRTL